MTLATNGIGLGLLAVSGLLGCGDAQVDASFRGAPLWSQNGAIQAGAPGFAGKSNIRAALFFSPHGLNSTDPTQLVEQIGSTTAVVVPSSYLLNIFEPPGPEHMLHAPDGSETGYAVGRTFIYVDNNQDGRYTPGEQFIGGGGIKVFIYAESDLPARSTPTSGPLPAGLTQIAVPQVCGTRPAPTDPGSCGVPLGNFCGRNEDCGSGVCLNQTATQQWREGYCSITEPPPSGCRPGAAAYMPAQVNGPPTSPGLKGYYLRPCSKDADCARPGEPTQNNYTCDLGLLGCVPTPPGFGLFIVGGGYDVEPFCPS